MVLTVPALHLDIVPLREPALPPLSTPGDERWGVGLHLAEELQHQAVLQQAPVVGEADQGGVEDDQLDVEAVHLAQAVVCLALVQPCVLQPRPADLQPVLPCPGVGQQLPVQPGPGDGGRGVALGRAGHHHPGV